MRNLRKILAVVVVVAFIAMSSIVPAFADTALSASTQTCADLGMLLGTGNGVTAEYAATTPTRIQAAVLFLRLKGLEADAKAFVPSANFADADKASWAAPIMGYLKANPALGWVGDGTNFNPNDAVTAQQYYKVVLTALGYVQDTDFTYANTLSFAKDTAKLAMAGNVDKFTIDAVAAATVEGLGAVVKGGTDNLATVLVKANKLDATKAQTAGLYNPVVAVNATLAATGAKILTVTFNQAVDTTKASFSVAKGSFGVNISSTTWDAAKTVATLNLATKLTAGDYTVKVSGLTTAALSLKVTATDETVSKIEFPSTTLVLDRNDGTNKTVYTSYKVLNQYGEDVTDNYTPTFTASKGTYSIPDAGTVQLVAGAAYASGDSVSISAIYAANATFATQAFTVAAIAQVADISIDGIYNANDDVPTAGDNANVYDLKLTLKDQYGNALPNGSQAALDLASSDIIVRSSDTTIADYATKNINGDAAAALLGTDNISGTTTTVLKLKNMVIAKGTATFTIISKTTGHIAKFDFVVKDTQKADSVTMSAPDLVVANEDTVIPFTAIDQFGATITSATSSDLSTLVVGVTGAPAGVTADFSQDYVKGVPVLTLRATGKHLTTATNVTLSVTTSTGKYSTLTVSMQPDAVPTVVETVNNADGNTDFNANLGVNATTEIDAGNIVVDDQYGRAMDMSDLVGTAADQYQYFISTSDSTNAVETLKNSWGVADTSAAIYDTTAGNPGGKVTLTGVAKGTATITVVIAKGTDTLAGGTTISNTDYTFNSKVVADADIVTYALADPGKLWADGVHTYTPSVTGTTADGTVVTVPAVDYTAVAATSDGNITMNPVTNVTTAANGFTANSDDIAVVPIIVTVYGANGTVVLNKNLTVTKAAADAPAIATLSIASSGNWTVEDSTNFVVSALAANINDQTKINNAITAILSAKDQYGDDIAATLAANPIYSNNSNDHALTAVAQGDTFSVTVVTVNGISKVFKFIAK